MSARSACSTARQLRHRLRDTLDEEAATKRFASTGGWLGFTDKYWLTALAPDQAARRSTPASASGAGGGYQADLCLPPTSSRPARPITTTRRACSPAPRRRSCSTATRTQLGIPKLDKAIDWGWFEWFMRPIFSLLNWLFARSAISAWRSSA
jgi:YidC/Oxa1 family membrane protein insertase